MEMTFGSNLNDEKEATRDKSIVSTRSTYKGPGAGRGWLEGD